MLTVNFEPFPVLTTERLVLRAVRDDDKDDLFVIRSNTETMRYVSRPVAQTVEDMRALIEKIRHGVGANEHINWMITEKGRDKVIGMIGLPTIKPESHRAEVGFMLNYAYQGKGIAREALKKVMDYCFDVLGFNSLEARIRPDNIASQKVVENAGFNRDAYFKEYKYYKGQFWDALVYSLITPHK